MRFRTVVLAGTAGAAVTYLFDPRKGSARRSRLRSSVASLAHLGTDRPIEPLPPNLAPMRGEPIGDDVAVPAPEAIEDVGTGRSASGIDGPTIETPAVEATTIETPAADAPTIETPAADTPTVEMADTAMPTDQPAISPTEEEEVVDLVSIERNGIENRNGIEGRSDDDGAIVQRVRSRLDERRDLRTDDLTVDVVNGVAYLCGELHDPHTFGEVVEVTRATPGVRRVQSLLHLPESEVLARIAGRSSAGDPRD
jgi:hypothetical protein